VESAMLCGGVTVMPKARIGEGVIVSFKVTPCYTAWRLHQTHIHQISLPARRGGRGCAAGVGLLDLAVWDCSRNLN